MHASMFQWFLWHSNVIHHLNINLQGSNHQFVLVHLMTPVFQRIWKPVCGYLHVSSHKGKWPVHIDYLVCACTTRGKVMGHLSPRNPHICDRRLVPNVNVAYSLHSLWKTWELSLEFLAPPIMNIVEVWPCLCWELYDSILQIPQQSVSL